MPGLAYSRTLAPAAPPPPRFPSAPVMAPAIFLPKEHGSWSLVLEPLALGLLVAPSSAGAALAAVALAGFFARRPLKAALDPARSARRTTARKVLGMFAILALAGLLETVVLGGWTALWPLLPAGPLGLLFIHCDAQGGARAAAAEIAGSAAFAVVPAALATLAGWPARPALALAAVALARSVPTVLTVRTALRIVKREPVGFGLPLSAAALAAGALTALASLGFVPRLATVPAWLLLGRTAWFASALRPAWPARRLGLFEALLGGLSVGLIALAYHLQ